MKSVVESPESGLENGDASTVASYSPTDETGEDDEDRRTIRGVVLEGESEQGGKRSANGPGVNGAGPKEKSFNVAIPASSFGAAP